MVKHTQTIRQNMRMNCLSVFDHFVGVSFAVKSSISKVCNVIFKVDIHPILHVRRRGAKNSK